MKKIFTIVMFVVASLVLSSCELMEEGQTYSMKFKLDGVQKEFKTDEDSGFYYDPEDGSWSCSWYDGGDEIYIYFKTPKEGDSYTDPTDLFTFTYITAEDDWIWTDTGFNITITQWGENEGDIQKGTFSGNLDGQAITEGTFEAAYTDTF